MPARMFTARRPRSPIRIPRGFDVPARPASPGVSIRRASQHFGQRLSGAILDAVQAYDPSSDRLSRRFTALRERPGRWLAKLGFARVSKPFGLRDFIPLDRVGDREMAAGLVGRFWRLDYGLVPMPDAAAFAAFTRPGTPKLVIGFLAEPEGDRTRLITETRVYCPDRLSLVLFTPYWLVIRLFSGYMRRRFLGRVKQTVESSSSWNPDT